MPPKATPVIDPAVAAAQVAAAAAAIIEVTLNQKGNPKYIVNGYGQNVLAKQEGKTVETCMCDKQSSAFPCAARTSISVRGEVVKIIGEIPEHPTHDLDIEKYKKWCGGKAPTLN